MALDIGTSLHVVQFSILYYDYALTFSREIQLFWKQPRRSWPFVLFIANRYIAVLGHVPSALYYFWSPSVGSSYSWCNPFLPYNGARVIVVQMICAVVMIMRVYALYERSRHVLAVLLFVVVGAIAVGTWAVSSSPSSPSAALASTQELPIGCPGKGFLTSDQGLNMAAAWGGQLLFDVVVFGLTLWRSLYCRIPGKRSISDVLLRDGCLYFAVMSVANVGNIVTLLLANDGIKDVASGITNVVSVTMISRLMLNLRDPSIVGPAVATFPPLSHPSAFATTRGLPGVETTATMA